MSVNHNWLRYLTTAGGCRDKESPAAVCHLSEKANTFGESDPTRLRCPFHRFRLQECKQLPLHFNGGNQGKSNKQWKEDDEIQILLSLDFKQMLCKYNSRGVCMIWPRLNNRLTEPMLFLSGPVFYKSRVR